MQNIVEFFCFLILDLISIHSNMLITSIVVIALVCLLKTLPSIFKSFMLKAVQMLCIPIDSAHSAYWAPVQSIIIHIYCIWFYFQNPINRFIFVIISVDSANHMMNERINSRGQRTISSAFHLRHFNECVYVCFSPCVRVLMRFSALRLFIQFIPFFHFNSNRMHCKLKLHVNDLKSHQKFDLVVASRELR